MIRTPQETVSEAQRLLDDDNPFRAHEVFEDAWKLSDGPDRLLWKGLAQFAVGLTHLARGNQRGAVALLRRGSEAIAPFQDHTAHGIDVAGLMHVADKLTGELETGSGRVVAPPIRLRDATGTRGGR